MGSPRTWTAAAEAGSPRLTGLPGVDTAAAQPPVVLEVERYDTDDLRLAAAGIRLELRRGPESAQWLLRLPEGDGEDLLRVPAPVPDVEGVDPQGPPDELDALVRGARRERPLRAVGRVRTVRTETSLLADGRLVAVVIRDEVSVATLGASTTIDTWTEFDVAPHAADAALLGALSSRIGATGAHQGHSRSDTALDRLLVPAPARRGRTGPKGSAGAVLMAYLAVQADRLAAEDVRARRDEPDAVHQLRVASRRMRAALQAYRPLLDRERTDPLVERLRHLGRALAPARDTEVLRERITAGIEHLDVDLVLGPVGAQVTRHFAREEAETRAAVLAELDGPDYVALRTAVDDLLADPPLTRRAARPASKELPKLVGKSARRLERAVAELDTDKSDDAVHRVRKAAKRVRYTTDVARPAVSGKAKRFTRGIKGIQSVLGEHQDAVVARGVLRELGAQAHSAGENGFTFGLLYAHEAVVADRIHEQLPALWRKAWRPKVRRWMR